MDGLRYGVCGHPIKHSLSPLLMSLVHEHLLSQKIRIPGTVEVAIVPAKKIENGLAWGYAGALPSPPDWDLVGSPLGKFRANTLLKRAAVSATEIKTPEPSFPSINRFKKVSDVIPNISNEVWLSLTSPLKHQLSIAAVRCMDQSMELRSINSLRWDGLNWWVANTDGLGFVEVAIGFGYQSKQILGIHGGGGAARSVAAAWSSQGGRVAALESKRPLDEEGPWDLVEEEPDFVIDFDHEPGQHSTRGDIQSGYVSMEGDVAERVEKLSKIIDGRWLLCAQHLAAWANLWAPGLVDFLPSVELLMTRLVYAEHALSTRG